MFGIDDVLTGGLSLLSGITNNLFAGSRQSDAQNFNAQQAVAARDFSASEAQRNRDFQQNMSDTSYTRAATDMQRAGLNRILAAGGGASTPSGSMASSASAVSSPGAPVHDMLGPAVNTAMAHARLKQEIENMKMTNDNIAKDTRLKVVQGNTEDERTRTQAAETIRTLSDVHLKDTTTHHTANEIAKQAPDVERSKIDAAQLRNKAFQILRQTGNIGKEIERGTSAVGNLPALFKSGGRADPLDYEETTYAPGGRERSTRTRSYVPRR